MEIYEKFASSFGEEFAENGITNLQVVKPEAPKAGKKS